MPSFSTYLGIVLAVAPWAARARSAEPGHVVQADVGLYAASHQASRTLLLSPTLRTDIALTSCWNLRLAWGVAHLNESSATDAGWSQSRLANPMLAGVCASQNESVLTWMGAGLALPFARLESGPNRSRSRSAYAYASGIRGLWDMGLWAPERLSVWVPFAVSNPPQGRLRLGLRGAALLLIPVGSFAKDRNDVVIQAAGTIGLRGEYGRLDAELRTVVILIQPRDRVQLSFAPSGTLDIGQAFLRAELVLPFYNPLGRLRLWSLSLGGGARL